MELLPNSSMIYGKWRARTVGQHKGSSSQEQFEMLLKAVNIASKYDRNQEMVTHVQMSSAFKNNSKCIKFHSFVICLVQLFPTWG